MRKTSYSKLPTEQSNSKTSKIDRISIVKAIEIINQEDQLVPKAISKVKGPIARAVRLIVDTVQHGGRIFFSGAGTSGRLGILEAAECPPTFNTSPALVQAVIAGGKNSVFRSKEGAEDNAGEAFRIFSKKLKKKDIVIGIAASGVTPFVKGSLKAAKSKGCKTILIACNASSPLKSVADCLICPKVGPEVITGSTRLKAGTATKLVLNTLTVVSMIQLGKVYRNWMVDLQPKNAKLKARALRLIENLGECSPREALRYLDEARKNVKLAILMSRKGLNYKEAFSLLKTGSGSLKDLIHS